jgi:hypothetical protein
VLRALVFGLALASILSGCTNPPPRAQEFEGTFTEYAKGQDVADFRRRMAEWTSEDVLVYETFPLTFRVPELAGNCERARQEAESLYYVAHVEPCRDEEWVPTQHQSLTDVIA